MLYPKYCLYHIIPKFSNKLNFYFKTYYLLIKFDRSAKCIVNIDQNDNILHIQDLDKGTNAKSFKFSKIYDETSSTKSMYDDVCYDMVEKVRFKLFVL